MCPVLRGWSLAQTQCGTGGTTTELIVARLPPAGYPYEAAPSSPHTVMPNGPLLEAVCGPFWQLLCCATPPFTMSTHAYSYVSPASTGFQPVTVPTQSMVTSWKPWFVLL